MPVFETVARVLRLGRWKGFKGYDLEGNKFFELPHPLHPGSTRRSVEYRVKREWSEYGSHSIPIQWYTWLRKARQDPPTLEELRNDVYRQQKLRSDVAELEGIYRQERAQLAEEQQQMRRLQRPERPDPSVSDYPPSESQSQPQSPSSSTLARNQQASSAPDSHRSAAIKQAPPGQSDSDRDRRRRNKPKIDIAGVSTDSLGPSNPAGDPQPVPYQKPQEVASQQSSSKQRENTVDDYEPETWSPKTRRRR